MSEGHDELDYAGGGLCRPEDQRLESQFLWGAIWGLILTESVGGEA